MLTTFHLFESKKIAQQKFLDKGLITEEEFEKFLQFDERLYKYLPWMLDVWVKTKKLLDPDEIEGIVRWFDINTPRLQVKDIYKYTYEELLEKEAELGISKKEQEKILKNQATEEIFENEDLKIVLIKTYQAAEEFNGYSPKGGRSWCVGRAEQTWNTYTEHSTFYYVWYTPKKGESILFKRCAVQVQGNKIQVWNEEDSPFTLDKSPFAAYEKYFKFIPQDLRDRLLKIAHEVLSDGSYHFKANVNLTNKGIKTLREIPIKIKIVDGYFDVSGNDITDLLGAPEKVGSLRAENCKLKNLNGCSKTITEELNVNNNKDLVNLKGCTPNIGGNFTAVSCNLTSLIGGPKNVGGNYNVENNQIKSLLGAPESVGKIFNLDNNKLEHIELEDLQLRKNVSAKKNPLKDYTGFTVEQFVKNNRVVYKETPNGIIFEGALIFNTDYYFDNFEELPFKILDCKSDFIVDKRKEHPLKNLKGCPDRVAGKFSVSSCNIESIIGAPKHVGKLNLIYNKIKSLEGFPETVSGKALLNGNPLISLKYIGQLQDPDKPYAFLYIANCDQLVDISDLSKNKQPIILYHNRDKTPDNLFGFNFIPPNVTLKHVEDIDND